jgi:pimeloyl-ACP methyl ester carboxylesterase
MPVFTHENLHLQYDIIGNTGPWVALSPGGRRGMQAVRGLAVALAELEFRVLIFDRRNCGASDVAFDSGRAEDQAWADDLHALLVSLDITTAWIGGGSSGCRMSLLYALKYPAHVSGLLLWKITGGAFAARRLAAQYFTDYIRLAESGGMAAVCASEHFSSLIDANPGNRNRLMQFTPEAFIAVMLEWQRRFVDGASGPVLGVSEDQLRGLRVPAFIIPGNDNTHPLAVGKHLHTLLPSSEMAVLFPEQVDADVAPQADWQQKEADIARLFAAFINRRLATRP